MYLSCEDVAHIDLNILVYLFYTGTLKHNFFAGSRAYFINKFKSVLEYQCL